MTDLDTKALEAALWSKIDQRIEATPVDGMGAGGAFSENVAREQRAFVKGMRAARLAARSAIRSLAKEG